jgi:hypothetical protein
VQVCPNLQYVTPLSNWHMGVHPPP